MIFDKLSTYLYVSKYIQIDLRYSYIDIIEKFNKFCDGRHFKLSNVLLTF